MIDAGRCLRVAQVKYNKPTMIMADEVGVSRQQIHRWRTATDMKISKMQEFSDYFGITLDEYIRLGSD